MRDQTTMTVSELGGLVVLLKTARHVRAHHVSRRLRLSSAQPRGVRKPTDQFSAPI